MQYNPPIILASSPRDNFVVYASSPSQTNNIKQRLILPRQFIITKIIINRSQVDAVLHRHTIHFVYSLSVIKKIMSAPQTIFGVACAR